MIIKVNAPSGWLFFEVALEILFDALQTEPSFFCLLVAENPSLAFLGSLLQ